MKTISKILLVILVIVFIYVLDWAVAIGVLKVMTLCFDMSYNIMYAIGIWLGICLIQTVFCSRKKSNA